MIFWVPNHIFMIFGKLLWIRCLIMIFYLIYFWKKQIFYFFTKKYYATSLSPRRDEIFLPYPFDLGRGEGDKVH
jgi:hypothetical protein